MGKFSTLVLIGCVVGGASAAHAASVDDAGSPAKALTGTLTGSVTLGSKLAAQRMRFSLYPDPNRGGDPSALPAPSAELHNVVVYLEHVDFDPDSAGAAPPRSPARMEQERLEFVPHVLPVVKGTEVEFPNRDLLFHNVFSLSKAASFDLGRFPKNGSKSLRFDTPGIVKVFCHIHSDMSGVIVVLENPFYAQPGTDGRFVIDGIPPGAYRVVAWHERARRAAKNIVIEAGKVTVLNFEIPLTEDADGG